MVRHNGDSGLVFLTQFLNKVHQIVALATVEVGSRFIGEDDFRTVGEGTRKRDALFFTTGELGGTMMKPIAQSDVCQ